MVDYGKPWLPVDAQIDQLVAHFRAKYDGQMPIWALTELPELSHISRRYAGLRNDLATAIATAFDVPTKRPRPGQVPLPTHLSESDAPKQSGPYNALAVMACLLRRIDPGSDWALRVATHLRAFPTNAVLDVGSMGVAPGWLDEDLRHS